MSIVVEHLTKQYGTKVVVDDLSFEVRPGRVTGFLGPNGAGKSTTMRLMVDLDRPDAGRVSIDGERYRNIRHPAHFVGTLLDAHAVDPARKARDHLRALAACSRVNNSRVDAVMEMTGITPVANKRVGQFSLGMHQRLGLAAAILVDPKHLLLDEPTNGLDPEGIRWVRQFLRNQADEGRSVLVSSHLLAELALFVDDLVVIGKGRLIAAETVEDFTSRRDEAVLVASPRQDDLTIELQELGATVITTNSGLRVSGTSAAAIGDLAAQAGIPLHHLTEETGSLEETFLELTADEREYRSTTQPA